MAGEHDKELRAHAKELREHDSEEQEEGVWVPMGVVTPGCGYPWMGTPRVMLIGPC